MVSDRDMLEIWERGWSRAPYERALIILDVCLPNHGVDQIKTLTIGQRDAMLLAMNQNMFGNAIESIAECPKCSEALEFTVGASELVNGYKDPSPALTVELKNRTASCTLPTTEHLIEFQNGAQKHPEGLLFLCIDSVEEDGKQISSSQLLPNELQVIGDAISESDNLSSIEFDLKCVECDHSWSAPFDIVSYLWTKIDSTCQKIVTEIHTLATFYGWTEQQILLLSRWRRQVYLNMARQQ